MAANSEVLTWLKKSGRIGIETIKDKNRKKIKSETLTGSQTVAGVVLG